ncbi:hypothetical protein I4F81_002182 [Pyropia yezoensis]|uniref:Uncharacterized protein n=1 Tax=Pyropia yezoensis TaxID=2788 RepID=A0ACC3BQ33_PYRYE|nr:hypothetical protein I4F81_002182 [Neopyropia yezoensis]
MGTVAVATRRIAVGEVVLVEAPLLTWTRDDTADLLRAYDALPPASRALLRGLYHPNVEDAEFLSWGGEAKLVADTGGRLPAPVPAAPTRADILLLLAVARFNAHAYTGHPAEKTVLELSRTGITGGDCHPKTALYATLSRMEHSCVPNLSYSSKLDAGAGRLTAIRPISSGDHLSLSYIDNPWVLPTALRRAQLYDGFAFFCRCSRCAGPDTARSVLCTKPCGGLATPLNADDPVWRCTMCNLCVDKMYVLAAEGKVTVSLAAMQERNLRTLSAPEEAAELVDDASRTLSPLHWLTLRASRDLEQLLSSHAHSLLSVARIAAEMGFLAMARAYPRDVGRLRIQAVDVSVASIKAVECLAASCGGGWPCRVNHPPVAEVIEWVFWVSQDLLEVPRSPPSSAAALAEELGLGPDRLCVRTITYEELQADAALAAINPIKRLPALLLPSGTVVVESGAIVSLLLSMHANDKRAQALLPPLDAPDDAHARALMFLHYAPASAYPLMRDTFLGTYGKRPEERDSAGLAATAATWAATVAALVGAALADGRAFLLGDTFTVADLMCTYEFLMVRWAGMDSDAVSGGDSRVAAWVDRLAERPSAVKVYAGLASMSINDGAAAA